MDPEKLNDLLQSLQQQSNEIQNQPELSTQSNQSQSQIPINEDLTQLLNSLQPINQTFRTIPHQTPIQSSIASNKRIKFDHSAFHCYNPTQQSTDKKKINLANSFSSTTSAEGEINQNVSTSEFFNRIPTQTRSLLSHSQADEYQITPQEQTQHPVDVTRLTLPQALPILIKSIESTNLLDKIQAMKERQEQSELRLIDERNRMKSEHERILKKLDSPSDAEKIKNLGTKFEIELTKFDRSVLSKWDQLKNQQQLELENLQVPSFFETDEPEALTNQNHIINILIEHINK